ncbi:hypothetical protein C8J57DRAFT_1474203 [Mycena rebaudengoi]|nr:hypothetical protein C8J57DRAFT_1474203 [Mycena rebaudengoi]
MASKFVNNSWEASKTETSSKLPPPLPLYSSTSFVPQDHPHTLSAPKCTPTSPSSMSTARGMRCLWCREVRMRFAIEACKTRRTTDEKLAAQQRRLADGGHPSNFGCLANSFLGKHEIAHPDGRRSSRLGEGNLRILEHGVPVKPPARQYKNVAEPVIGQRVGSPTTKGPSSATRPRRRPCRTRDSRTWWKAPKRLFMSIFSDKCGTNWREYADLDMRPECYCRRQRTPLAPSVSKRAKVGAQTSAHSTPRRKRLSPLKFVVSRAAKVLKFKQCEFRVHAGNAQPARRDLFLISPQLSAVVGPESVASWHPRSEFVSVVPTGGAKKIPPGENEALGTLEKKTYGYMIYRMSCTYVDTYFSKLETDGVKNEGPRTGKAIR